MVESFLETEKEQPTEGCSTHVVRVRYGEHVVRGKQKLVIKQTNSYKILLIVNNYYLIKYEAETEGSLSDIDRL